MRIRYIVKIAVTLVALAALGSLLLVFRWDLGAHTALAIMGYILFAILVIAAFIALTWLGEVRGRSIVQRWATKNGYAVLQFERTSLTGAFNFLTTSRGQIVYCVTVRDETGQERKAWVRCGSFCGGVLFSDEIEVKWA